MRYLIIDITRDKKDLGFKGKVEAFIGELYNNVSEYSLSISRKQLFYIQRFFYVNLFQFAFHKLKYFYPRHRINASSVMKTYVYDRNRYSKE